MEQIYKSKHFGHIDLSKIISIRNPKLSSGGNFIGFEVIVQLRDDPLSYSRRLNNTEMKWKPGVPNTYNGYNVIRTIDHEWKRHMQININHDTTVAEFNLQSEINELISAWKNYSTAHEVANYPRAPSCALEPRQ